MRYTSIETLKRMRPDWFRQDLITLLEPGGVTGKIVLVSGGGG